MVEHTICSTCQADISGVAGQHLDETMHAGYYSGWRKEQTGTKTYTVNHPELETAKELASVADYVDYKSNKYAYVHISPDFLDWYVTIPVNDSYCEVNDCGSTIQK